MVTFSKYNVKGFSNTSLQMVTFTYYLTHCCLQHWSTNLLQGVRKRELPADFTNTAFYLVR